MFFSTFLIHLQAQFRRSRGKEVASHGEEHDQEREDEVGEVEGEEGRLGLERQKGGGGEVGEDGDEGGGGVSAVGY